MAFGFEGGGGDEGLAGQDAGVGDEITGGRVVGTVKDEVVLLKEGDGGLRGEVVGVALVVDTRV